MEEKPLLIAVALFSIKEIYEIYKAFRNKTEKKMVETQALLRVMDGRIHSLEREVHLLRDLVVSAFRPFAEKRGPEDSLRDP